MIKVGDYVRYKNSFDKDSLIDRWLTAEVMVKDNNHKHPVPHWTTNESLAEALQQRGFITKVEYTWDGPRISVFLP